MSAGHTSPPQHRRQDAVNKAIRILVVDDDSQIRSLLCDCLADFGMTTAQAGTGAEMHLALGEGGFDLVVLDLMLPDDDGLNLCREIRATSEIPLIILTARGEMTDRIVGLELGADDYIVKPFEPRELVARIQTILRRVRAQTQGRTRAQEESRFAGWRLHQIGRHLIAADNTVIPLSNAEFRLLNAFLAAPGRVLSREYLMDTARGKSIDTFDRSIDVQISRLRQKLREDIKEPRLIRTIRGEGYMLDVGHR
ncbi:two-component system response regulator [Burkholderia cepacia JBK9]|uniref:response regulator n=1 Tax=Burkholderia arboris TaxID=488730 RepID=UPI0004D4B93A|nr:response regulator transcription factor [Burkholderia arboris]ALX12428.1 two-component system response regulator [Burkholderia cepacia JBK9]MCA8493271.1 response regulator transcription factor [Burkholderia arboris]UTV55996.1 response regulator transcription factor [Burkholderia arboris]